MKLTTKQRELFNYALFGVLTTLVNWGVYFALTSLLQPETYPLDSAQRRLILNASQLTAWVLSVIFAFFTNKRYVFKSDAVSTGAWRELLAFSSARVVSYLLFDVLVYNLFVFNLGVGHSITKVLMNVLVVLFNYFASKYLVFRKNSENPDEPPPGPD